MVRAPCCEKMGMKKGPWTAEEDQVLINFISLYGHGNWRALPKQAGLLRCGKSCRLRWTNYLRPDIKRGNFTKDEEYTIINLHQLLGNRWSTIAARLPGRTDNEIKNVWHTHLKKKLVNKEQKNTISKVDEKPQAVSTSTNDISSSLVVLGTTIMNNSHDLLKDIDESFWSNNAAAVSVRNKRSSTVPAEERFSDLSPFFSYGMQGEPGGLVHASGDYNVMDFWYEMLDGSGEFLFVSDII